MLEHKASKISRETFKAEWRGPVSLQMLPNSYFCHSSTLGKVVVADGKLDLESHGFSNSTLWATGPHKEVLLRDTGQPAMLRPQLPAVPSPPPAETRFFCGGGASVRGS